VKRQTSICSLSLTTQKPISLIGLVHIENRLSDLLGRKVDLVQERSLKARIRANVECEAVLAFQ
jgi:predicted nucleotidyltransferase